MHLNTLKFHQEMHKKIILNYGPLFHANLCPMSYAWKKLKRQKNDFTKKT